MLNSCQHHALTIRGSRAEAGRTRQAGRTPRGCSAAAARGLGPAGHGSPGHAPGHACRRRCTEGRHIWATGSTGRHGGVNRCACPGPLAACMLSRAVATAQRRVSGIHRFTPSAQLYPAILQRHLWGLLATACSVMRMVVCGLASGACNRHSWRSGCCLHLTDIVRISVLRQLACSTGRPTSKRKKWQPAPEGPGAEAEERGEGGRVKRKQTRRPDRRVLLLSPRAGHETAQHFQLTAWTICLESRAKLWALSCTVLRKSCSAGLTCKTERASYPDWRQHIKNRSGVPASPALSHRQLMGCRLCHHENCFVTPTYNYPGEKKRIFCVTHKLEGMVSDLSDVFSA